MAVRIAMEHPICALPRTPFPASRDFAPVGSMSLDFQVASLSYKSSSFATSRGNEKIGGTGYCVTYDTDSQSRNVLASPLGEEGHEVAKGWTVVILIMILDVDVTAEGGIIKLIARKGNPQPYEPSEPFSSQPFYTTCRRQAATTLGPEARQPSHRRCVQWRQPPPPPFEP